MCFRPLAGIMVLIFHTLYLGVYGSLENEYVFPSPCGDYGSYRGLWPTFVSYQTVSVPLRGLWFLSVAVSFISKPTRAVVSVPLRGLWFLSGKDAQAMD